MKDPMLMSTVRVSTHIGDTLAHIQEKLQVFKIGLVKVKCGLNVLTDTSSDSI